MKTAVYGGTFDPPTNGHVWTIHQAADLFDEVVIAVGVNPDKQPFFPLSTRLRMLEEIVRDLPNVRVVSFDGAYLVDFAAQHNARYVVRGVRNAADYEYERTIRLINADIDDSIRTVLLVPPRELAEVSSSLVKSLVGPSGWEKLVARYVPQATLIQLIGRRHHWLSEALVQAGAVGEENVFWTEVLTPYFAENRVYHSWRHICAGLNELAGIRALLHDMVATGLAWLCHDIVYDVSRSDNEERSAEFVETLAERLKLPKVLGASANRMVMATKSHASVYHDTQYLVDIDLAILGYPDREFDAYERGVAAEYANLYTPKEFADGRADWVLEFLAAHPDRIYCTDLFEKRCGAQARKNLYRSLGRL